MAGFLDFNFERRKIYSTRRDQEKNKNFKKLFRFSQENVNWLAVHFLPEYEETRGGALTNVEKMKTFLRYISDPGFQTGVGEDIGVHQSTVSRTVWSVCNNILQKKDYWLQFPITFEALQEAKNLWQLRFKFPNAIGAIDATHICIQRPPGDFADEYVNRKRDTSINVQATCNALEIFTSVDCSFPGSVHDSRIYRNSTIKQVLHENPAHALLLADKAYAISPWILTPFRNTRVEMHRIYNKLHRSERQIIERVFGQVKNRFPFLKYEIRMKTDRVASMITCCFILHNVAKRLRDEDFDNDDVHYDVLDLPLPGDGNNDELQRRGTTLRDNIANYIIEHNLVQ